METDEDIQSVMQPLGAFLRIQKSNIRPGTVAEILLRSIDQARRHLKHQDADAIAAIYAHPFANFLPEELREIVKRATDGAMPFAEAEKHLDRLAKRYRQALLKAGIVIPVKA